MIRQGVLAAMFLMTAGCATAPVIEGAAQVSVAELLADPAAYDGRQVSVRGYLVLQFEGSALWADPEAREARTWDRAIWLTVHNLSREQAERLTERPAMISGTFWKGSCGHLSAFNGAIENITIIAVEGETPLMMMGHHAPDAPPFCL